MMAYMVVVVAEYYVGVEWGLRSCSNHPQLFWNIEYSARSNCVQYLSAAKISLNRFQDLPHKSHDVEL